MNVEKWGLVALLVVFLVMLAALGITQSNLKTSRQETVTEGTAHNATRAEYATARSLWLADQRNSNATIRGLQRQVNGTQAAFADYRRDEAARQAMLKKAITRTRTPEEQQKVVDHETRRRAADLLNTW